MNKKQLLSILLAVFSIAAVNAQQQFGLQECLDYALQNSYQVRISEQGINLADAQIAETRSMGLPQINGSLSFTNNPAVQAVVAPNFLTPVIIGTMNQEGYATTSNPNDDFGVIPLAFGIRNSAMASLSVSQLIFDGSYFVALQASKTYKELSEQELKENKIAVVESVSKAYYQVLINRERIRLIEANLERLDQVMKETKAMSEAGLVDKIDYNRVRVSFNNVRTNFEQTKRMLMIAEKNLKLQMGMNVEEEVEFTGEIRDVEIDLSIPEADLAFKYEDRIEFTKNKTNLTLTQLDWKNNRAGYLPKLNANANMGYNGGAEEFSNVFNNDNWFEFASVGVSLSIPIFDGLARNSRMQRNKAQIRQLELQRDMLKNSIDLEIEAAVLALENAMETLALQKENMELAEEVFESATARYRQGLGSNLEVTESDSSLKESQSNYFFALYDAVVAKIELKKAMGLLL